MTERVGVVGGGIMGAGIAEVCARAGLEVLLHDVDAARAAAVRDRIESSLERAVQRGKVSDEDARGALGRLRPTSDLTDLQDSQLVIEAIIEDEQAKLKVFAELDTLIDDDAILASNT